MGRSFRLRKALVAFCAFGALSSVIKADVSSTFIADDILTSFTVTKHLLEGMYSAGSTYDNSLPMKDSLMRFAAKSSVGVLKGFLFSKVVHLQALGVGFDFGKWLAAYYFPPASFDNNVLSDTCDKGWGGFLYNAKTCLYNKTLGKLPSTSDLISPLVSPVLSYGCAAAFFLGAHGLWTLLPSGTPIAMLTAIDIFQHISRLETLAGDPKATLGVIDNAATWMSNSELFKQMMVQYGNVAQRMAVLLGGISLVNTFESMSDRVSKVWNNLDDGRNMYLLGGGAGAGLLLMYYGKTLYKWYAQRKQEKAQKEGKAILEQKVGNLEEKGLESTQVTSVTDRILEENNMRDVENQVVNSDPKNVSQEQSDDLVQKTNQEDLKVDERILVQNEEIEKKIQESKRDELLQGKKDGQKDVFMENLKHIEEEATDDEDESHNTHETKKTSVIEEGGQVDGKAGEGGCFLTE